MAAVEKKIQKFTQKQVPTNHMNWRERESEWKREKNLQAQKALPDPNALVKSNAYPKTRKRYGNKKNSFTSLPQKEKEKKSLD